MKNPDILAATEPVAEAFEKLCILYYIGWSVASFFLKIYILKNSLRHLVHITFLQFLRLLFMPELRHWIKPLIQIVTDNQ